MTLNKNYIIFCILFFILGCADYQSTEIKKKEKKYFSSTGFALIYEDNFFNDKIINKKLNNDEIIVMHSFLKKNTNISITNPDNSKSIKAKVNINAKYPKIFNIVISKKIASFLEIDLKNPYVEINEIKKNKTFIAKEGNIFDEEKKVAGKAPVDEIIMDDITKEPTVQKKKKSRNFKFSVIISDFYYINSANNLKNELIKKTKINNISVIKINNNKYRLLVGPFENFNALKTAYISLNKLGFEELNIYKE
jgi:rare lipoprotein A (peptidoglycan hydrolase)